MKAVTALAALLLITTQLPARDRMEEYFLDNDSVQMFRKQLGKWHQIPHPAVIVRLAKEAGVTSRTVYRINRPRLAPGQYRPGSWVFVPFSRNKQKLLRRSLRANFHKNSRKSFIWPVRQNHYLTSRHGKRWGGYHTGLDIACPRNTPVVAARSGRVVFSGSRGALGNLVEIQHGKQISTAYAHNTRLLVRKGEYVRKGQLIAWSGTTGRSTGPHLHFEVRFRDVTLNPEDFLPPFIPNLQQAHNSQGSGQNQ
jgi:murein DD-endopeptidase MepM/ murein hydrolase activator NlpD